MSTRTLIAFLLIFFATSVVSAKPSTKNQLIAAKAAVMDADYRGDLARLASLREEIKPLSDDPSLGYLADYWTGYASWRLAANGSNEQMTQDDLKAHLDRAAADFESSLRKREDFADAYAAASSVHGWIAFLHRDDQAIMNAHIETSKRFLTKAESLEPDNPRVLWVRGGVFLFAPPAYGGSPERAIETYRKQIDASGPLMPSSPLPDWGKPEALMSLAYALMIKSSPDLDAATDNARAALKLQPQWHYARDILMPQIEAKRKQMTEGK
ncbi:MAG TPA: hypothetical protein VN380_21030 [Thermoanaerobaculia bacterium]|jgi:hypothetical protein|nr:hypothetical protein [Thermoanaerobaculia bacterium]